MFGGLDWPKMLRFQEKSGWCGQAVIQMALLAKGIKKSQKEIAEETYDSWWGTSQQTILAYLSQYFKNYGQIENARISDITFHLAMKHIIIANWWDNLEPNDTEGHYSLIVDLNRKKGLITLADPSQGRGIKDMDLEDFLKRWFDYLDVQQKLKIKRWMLWVDPKPKV